MFLDATPVEYGYDDASRMSSVKVAAGTVASYGYDTSSNLLTTTLPAGNGYVETRSYDRSDRLSEVKHTRAGADLSKLTYTRDAVGNPRRTSRLEAAWSVLHMTSWIG